MTTSIIVDAQPAALSGNSRAVQDRVQWLRPITQRLELRNFSPMVVGATCHVSETAMIVVIDLEVVCRDTSNPLAIHFHDAPIAWAQVDARGGPLVRQAVRRAVMRALLHELDECFLDAGVRFEDPHDGRPKQPDWSDISPAVNSVVARAKYGWEVVAERSTLPGRPWDVYAIHSGGGDRTPLGPNRHNSYEAEVARLVALVERT